ncbi:MAG: GGDEF domain-containing protein [Clostridium sp.]|nr:GGDEF domain-containing protein [Clostridium sp.]
MYHCHVHFYLTGAPNAAFEVIQKAQPLAHFTHEFVKSDEPDASLSAKADVIVANLKGMDVRKALDTLCHAKKKEAQLIVLADNGQMSLLTDGFADIWDIWNADMSEDEAGFRILRWQQAYKQDKDFWQTRNYLESTINSIPHLVWYKDKDGVHKKVNESFCKAVNKTMEQIEGRGHFYIWDIEPDEYAKGEFICMESEFEVMEKRETCVFAENVKIGDSMRELTTYKSPLFDLDGSVMGTVGVAVDVTQERLYERMLLNNANTDALTGLYNRRYVYQFVEEKAGQPFTIYYIDLDNFKSINDEFGHSEGDRALTVTADVLKECMPDDVITRAGGDEFVIIELGEHMSEEVEKKRKWLEESLEKVYKADEHLRYISASIGTAYTKGDINMTTIDELVKEADAFMYREKNRKKQEKMR